MLNYFGRLILNSRACKLMYPIECGLDRLLARGSYPCSQRFDFSVSSIHLWIISSLHSISWYNNVSEGGVGGEAKPNKGMKDCLGTLQRLWAKRQAFLPENNKLVRLRKCVALYTTSGGAVALIVTYYHGWVYIGVRLKPGTSHSDEDEESRDVTKHGYLMCWGWGQAEPDVRLPKQFMFIQV